MQKESKKIFLEGKTKILYDGPSSNTLIQHFTDKVTTFNNQKHGNISGKGVINNKISEFIMDRLNQIGVQTHFVKSLNMREQLVRSVDMIPIEVVIRNVAAGGMSQKFQIDEGVMLSTPVIEFYYKNDTLSNPFINEDQAIAFGWISPIESEEIKYTALKINDFLLGLFTGIRIRLVDCKLEFGRLIENDIIRIIVADEISPDTCRLWDLKTNEKLDKDRFVRDLGNIEEAYKEIARRLGILPN